MFTGMDSLVAHQQRGEVAREIYSDRLERELRTGRRPAHGRRWSFRRPREIPAPTSMPSSRKIAHLSDAGFANRY